MPVKVYIWKKQKNLEVVGHASMSLSDGTHISWWPESSVGKKALSAPARKGQTLKDDINFEECDPDMYTIEMSSADEEKIKAWWDNFKVTNNEYHLIKMNCSTVVYLALRTAYPSLMVLAVNPVWIPAAIERLAQWLGAGTTFFDEEKKIELESLTGQAAAEFMQYLSA